MPYEQLRDGRDRSGVQAGRRGASGWRERWVNPRRTTPGAPIYGMPILHANQARQVVFMNFHATGFAGIENDLLYEPTTTLLFGDARTPWQAARRAQALTVNHPSSVGNARARRSYAPHIARV